MALDIGMKRVGIAISDAQASIATPLCTLSTQEVLNCGAEMKRLLEDWEPDALVCGLPLSLSGSYSSQTHLVKAQAQQLAKTLNLELFFVDERLSSSTARNQLRSSGLKAAQMKGKIDMLAASIFLQTWLDARMNKATS